MKRILLVAVMVMLACGSAWAADLNFSADAVVTTGEGGTASFKLYQKGAKQRYEMEDAGGGVQIVRPDRMLTWTVMTSEKMYMEMSFKPDARYAVNNPEQKADMKFIANEKIDGHPTKKYRVTMKSADTGKDEGGYAWMATDLKDVVIKFESLDGRDKFQYKNIKLGDGSKDSLYEVPKGFTKMDMPGMGVGGYSGGAYQGGQAGGTQNYEDYQQYVPQDARDAAPSEGEYQDGGDSSGGHSEGESEIEEGVGELLKSLW
ncbi:MAG: DUF4412 domain-containing protein [Nitrospirae bacterium]|nr:DUF4412 domain-containing protein [Nitrospirota bacterium]